MKSTPTNGFDPPDAIHERAGQWPDAIQWYEGMLLAPQHFQQFAQRQDALLHAHLSLAAPFHWGVQRVRFDRGALADGVLRVQDLEAVTPDGLLVRHTGAAGDLQVDLAPFAGAIKKRPLRIHLAVPALSSKDRYLSVDGAPVADANTGEGDLCIPRLRPRLRLLAVERPAQTYSSFPLAEAVIRDGAIGLSDFVAPCLQVPVDSSLGALCAALVRRLREKAAFHAARSQPGPEHRFVVHTLVAGLPPFEALFTTGIAHPFTLYVALCDLAGRLTALSGEAVPPALPPYNHNDPRASFGRVLAFAHAMIDSVRKTYAKAPFSAQNGVQRLVLTSSWLNAPLTVGLRRRVDRSEADMIAWIENSLIGSESVLRSIGERRILGAARRIVERDDRLGVGPSHGVTLVSISCDPAFVRAGEALVILNRGDPNGDAAPVEATLFVAADHDATTGDAP